MLFSTYQSTWTPGYWQIAESGVSKTYLLTMAWQMSMRSKGSLWMSGRVTTRSVSDSVKGRGSIPCRAQLGRDELLERDLERNPAQGVSHSDLPGRHGAQEKPAGRVLDQVCGSWRELGRVEHDPQERTGIQQQVHDSAP